MPPKRKTDPFLQTIRAYIRENRMLKKGDRIAVGVSGGPDSVCLLFVLKEIAAEYGADLFAVHVGHGIRGKEAEDDAAFVKNCCGKWNIPFRFYGFDVPKIAKDKKMTVEEAGREVRRRAFLKCMPGRTMSFTTDGGSTARCRSCITKPRPGWKNIS